jgi:hypothetical protein
VLNGTKQWITNGGEAEIYTVVAITDRSRGTRGASAFIVEKGTPGFSFGKTTAHNLRLLAHLDAIVALGYPVLVGLSRKSSLGRITGKTPDDRLPASVAGALLAVQRGAAIVRARRRGNARRARRPHRGGTAAMNVETRDEPWPFRRTRVMHIAGRHGIRRAA